MFQSAERGVDREVRPPSASPASGNTVSDNGGALA